MNRPSRIPVLVALMAVLALAAPPAVADAGAAPRSSGAAWADGPGTPRPGPTGHVPPPTLKPPTEDFCGTCV